MATGLTGPSGQASFHAQSSPAESGSWLSGNLPDAFFSDSELDDQLTLTAEEQRIFDALGDNAAFAESLLSECPDEKEVILAAAQAAGLHKGGIRRTAFSMSDLQALQPPGPPSPPDVSAQSRDMQPSSPRKKIPKLESVPEGQPAPQQPFGTRPMHSADTAEPMRTSLEQQHIPMQLERSSSAMDGPFNMPGSLFTGGQPTEDMLPTPHMGLSSHQHGHNPGPSGAGHPGMFNFFPASSPTAHGHASQSQSGPSTQPSKENALLQGIAETLLKQQQQRQQPQQQQQQQGQQPASQSQPAPSQAQQASLAAKPPIAPSSAPAGHPPPPHATVAPAPRPPAPQQHESKPAAPARKSADEKERNLRRSQSAVELRSLSGGGLPRPSSDADLKHYDRVGIELTTPEGHTYSVGRLSNEDRANKILRYRQKRHERNFSKRIKYQCRKTLADSRPRVRGRFARNNDAGAVMPHETKKAQAERARRRAAEDPIIPKEEYFPELDYANLPPSDLLPTSGLPLSDLPPLPELGTLMPEYSSGMPGLSDSSNMSANMHFPGLSGNHTDPAFGLPPANLGMNQFGMEDQGSGDGPFSFGSGFIPDDLLNVSEDSHEAKFRLPH